MLRNPPSRVWGEGLGCLRRAGDGGDGVHLHRYGIGRASIKLGHVRYTNAVGGASEAIDSQTHARALGVPTLNYSRHGINERSSPAALYLNVIIVPSRPPGISAEDDGGGVGIQSLSAE